jgi:hypothetical protein
MTDIRHLVWHKTKGGQVLLAHGRTVASIEPDTKYPTMWRVRMPDGRLSDMARLEWAKEGAIETVLAELSRRKTASGGPTARQTSGGPTARPNGVPGLEIERAGQRALTDPESSEEESVDATLIARASAAGKRES